MQSLPKSSSESHPPGEATSAMLPAQPVNVSSGTTSSSPSLSEMSLEDLVVYRERLIQLRSRTDISAHRQGLIQRQEEILTRKSGLKTMQTDYAELLVRRTTLEKELARVQEELDQCRSRVDGIESIVITQQKEIDGLEKRCVQQEKLLAKVEEKTASLTKTLQEVDALIAVKRDVQETAGETSLEALLEDFEIVTTTRTTTRKLPMIFSKPQSTETRPMVHGEETSSQPGAVATRFELFANNEDDDSDDTVSDKLNPTISQKKMKHDPENGGGGGSASKRVPNSKCISAGRDVVRDFLELHKAKVKALFKEQHGKPKPAHRAAIHCQRIGSGIWRVSDEDNKKYGFCHIIGNNTNDQSFSVVLRQVRITQKLLDGVAEDEDEVDASFVDPRDAFEVSQALQILFENSREGGPVDV